MSNVIPFPGAHGGSETFEEALISALSSLEELVDGLLDRIADLEDNLQDLREDLSDAGDELVDTAPKREIDVGTKFSRLGGRLAAL